MTADRSELAAGVLAGVHAAELRRALTEPRKADDFWAAAKQLGETIAAQRAADRQAQRDARNARRRARYRATPRKPKTPAVAVVEDDLDVEPGCRCHVVRMPPCAWCESGAGDKTEEHPSMTADRSPELAAGVLAGIHAAELRRALTDLARRMDNRANEGDNPSDCLAMGDYADEIRDLVAKATPADPAAGDDPARTIARAAARSVVEYVPDEGWFPHDTTTQVPDACADATLAALAAAGLVLLSETAIERAARELHADNYRNRDARTDSWAAQTWPLLLDVERAKWIDKAERVLRAAAGGEDFTTAGPPHPTAAARAEAAAEQLPTVGRWPGPSPAADPWFSQPTTRLFLVHASGTVDEIDGGGDIAGGWSAPGLYERLVLAGFPLTRDDHAKNFDGLIDVGTDGTRVVAHASDGPHDMGSAEAELFLDWFKRAAT